MGLDNLIKKYTSCEDDDEQVEIIQFDFSDLKDASKWSFLLSLLDDESVYDLVKVEIYKVIQIEEFDDKEIITIKDAVLQSLRKEEDELVKQWGFISLEFNYCDFVDVIDLCVETIQDLEEDEDVRYNALSVLEKSKNSDKMQEVKEKILKVEIAKDMKFN